MIACPKCGFEQPKDQYCAKCGIDIERYEHKQKKLGTGFFSHPLFILSGLFVVLVASIYLIRKQQKDEVQDRMAMIRNGPLVYSASSSSSNSNPEDRQPTNVENPPAPTTASIPVAEKTTVPVAAAVSAATKPKAAKENQSVELKVYFLEVSKTELELYPAESVNLNQYIDFGDFKSGLITDLQRKLREKPTSKLLYQSEVKKFSAQNFQQTWFEGISKDESKIGLEFLINLELNDPELIKGSLEINRYLKESDLAPITKNPYPITSFVVNPPYSWMVILNLPVASYPGAEAFGPLGFLQIFRSPNFKDRKTADLLLLFDFKKTP